MSEEAVELHHQFAPQTFDDVIGQDDAMMAIKHKLDTNTLPHTILLTAPSGSGKTCIAHLIAADLGVQDDENLTIINAASERDIDSFREIISQAMQLSLGNKRRVWIIDEAVQIPKASQSAFLKITEKPPPGVYFIFCTTETTGLIPTLKSRCWEPPMKPLECKHVQTIITNAIKALDVELNPKVLKALLDRAGSNARLAFQLLETVITTEDVDKQLIFVGAAGTSLQERSEFLGKLLMDYGLWSDVQKSIRLLDPRQAESVSYAILAYASKVLLNSDKPAACVRAQQIILGFGADFTKTMSGGLAAVAFELCRPNPQK